MTLFSPDKIFVIGSGGTGGHLIPSLARLLAYHSSTQSSTLLVIDGDEYEEKNITRQIVPPSHIGKNKAQSMKEFCEYQGLNNVESLDDFISTSTLIPHLRKSICPLIVACVDNDATRFAIINAISNVCSDKNFFFITPGNSDGLEEVRGQVLWWGRLDGITYGMNPTIAFPAMANPQDSIPHKGSCALQAPSRPQLIAANVKCASETLTVIQNHLDGKLSPECSGIYFNIRNMKTTVS